MNSCQHITETLKTNPWHVDSLYIFYTLPASSVSASWYDQYNAFSWRKLNFPSDVRARDSENILRFMSDKEQGSGIVIQSTLEKYIVSFETKGSNSVCKQLNPFASQLTICYIEPICFVVRRNIVKFVAICCYIIQLTTYI